jgi:hypothetical protein
MSSNFVLILFILAITESILLFEFTYASSIGNSDCFPSREESNTLLCRSIPSCNESDPNSLFKSNNRFIFDLENKYHIDSKQFYNCSFSSLTKASSPQNKIDFIFRNIKLLNQFSFDSIVLRENLTLHIKFDGAGLNLDKKRSQSKLIINKNTFNKILFNRNSRLNIEIVNYELAVIGDALIDNGALWQNENSEINLTIKNVDRIIFKSKFKTQNDEDYSLGQNYEDDEESDETVSEIEPDLLSSSYNKTIIDAFDKQMFSFKNNLTYSISISNINALVFEENFFANQHVNSYSSFMIQIKNVKKSLSIGQNMFELLMLGYNANFNFLIENVGILGIDKNMFKGLQQEKYSVFYFYVENIGVKSVSDEAFESFDDYEDSNSIDYDSEQEPLSMNNSSKWICLPEGIFSDVHTADSTVTQIHFTQIEASITVSNNTMREITLGENSKFQLLFQDINGHLIFDENSFNLIRLNDGQFELWIDNQKKNTKKQGKINFKNDF